jgi:hypothetical protein
MNKREAFVRAVLVAGGVFYLLSGLGLLFIPEWFFQNIGNYPPFNRHYAGDVGVFLLPLGIALVWAAREPAQHRTLIAFAAAGRRFSLIAFYVVGFIANSRRLTPLTGGELSIS